MNKAILALDKVKAKLEAVERQKSEPVAVIGVACRLPGGGDTPEAFFRFLQEGGDAITQVPPERWRLDGAEGAGATPEARAVRWGGFLRDAVDRFDAHFFGISPREAAHLDPQQRLLLELGWEALERAGQDPTRLVGSATGVFLGISNGDYLDLCKAAGPAGEDVYAATGNGHAFAAGRLSYVFGFQGPSFAVDTVCSSSLVAVHLACQSLRSGEATLALAGGVNLMLAPETTRLTATTQALSPDGRCKTFDAAANGFVRSEGSGMIVLKLLSDALRDGDPILALIRGSAVNQDGRSTGLTTPNVLSQQSMLRQALANAHVSSEEIGYVEAHGTGTALGDPIEFEALRTVVGQPRPDGATCVLGAVKSNIGHLEAAAGIAGLIKVVMALREEVIPGNLHFRALNPRISLEGTPFVIPTESVPWPRGERPRLAGVSSFGMSGTNAHVILEEAPVPPSVEVLVRDASSTLLPISAKSPEALHALVRSYGEVLAAPEGARLADVAYTASLRRPHHEHRMAVIGRTREDMAEALAVFSRDGMAGGITQGRAPRTGRPKVVFVFSGQGSQWVGMGRQLLAEEPVFRSKLEQCSDILRRYVSWNLIDELQAPEGSSRLAETKVVQPALFAIQVALVKLMKSCGIRPDAVIGHSVGEVAAAHVAGVLPLEEAARLVAWRGRIMQKATGFGKMVWVGMPVTEAARAIAGREAVLSIGAVNDPDSVVLSGETAAVDDVVAGLTQRGIKSRALRVNYAFHSPQMTTLATELAAALGRIKPHRTSIPLYSTVTGAAIEGDALHSQYWARNMREPVLFARAVASAFADGNRLFLEVGPHPVLSANLTQCFAVEKEEGTAVASLRRHADERRAVLDALGTLYTRGLDPDWKAIQVADARSVALPMYPWQRERYWVEADPDHPHEVSYSHADDLVDGPEPRRDVTISRQTLPASPMPTPLRWRGESAAETRAGLLGLVRATVAAVLGFSNVAAVDVDRGFVELGLDSLMAVQLRNRLQDQLGAPLSATLAFDYPTVDRLVAHLMADVLDVEDRTAAPKSVAASNEPIAIVGAACRFPGGAEDLDGYWRLLTGGTVVASEVPSSRWSVAEWYDPDPEAPNKTYATKGGFLREVETFDPGFFRISPREATSLDPQQRLLLEVSWEALENAGQVPAELRESRTGVFLGATYNEYNERLLNVSDEGVGPYALTGNMLSVAAGRLSFFLGLHGPTLAVDTACSSSLVAMHLGCQSLRQGECDRALVGGVNLLLSPSGFVMLSRTRALAPDGRCKTFSAAADGYGRAEGCGVVVLKRLRDAQRDGDRILAVIRGTAINHDGASSGLTVPNGPAQQAVIREALAHAGVDPADVDFVECHGTGTPLGDPIEVQSLGTVYGRGRSPERPLVLGSAKAVIGHMEPVAGLVGLLKVVVALEHEQIPAQPEIGELNPHLPWDTLPVSVAREAVPWPRGARPRRAAVSSFGLSGTNAHVVLEEAPVAEPRPAAPAQSADLVVLSARSAAGLDAQAARLRDHLDAHPEQGLGEVAFSLATTRSSMEHRLAVAAPSREALRAALDVAARGQTPSGGTRGSASAAGVPKVVFVFPGQGSQWLGMSRQLMAEEPVFRAVLEACDRAIQGEAGWSLLAELAADEATSRLSRIDVVQPILFAVEVALAALWRSWGVEPAAVVGHSMGEVAAAHVAGALSLEDAAAIICRRSKLLRRISGQGEMAVVELSLADAEAAVRGREDRLSVAVSNSPTSTVLSGEPVALSEVLSALEAKGVFCRRVKVDVASHSPQVDPLREDLLAALDKIAPHEATVPMLSTVTGATVAGPELVSSYWVSNLRQPVRFAQVVQALLQSGHGLFVEMSPHPILTTSVEDIRQASGKEGAAVGSLRRARDERPAMLEALGTLWVQGHPVAWEKLLPAGGRRVPLPTYPWQRARYWLDATHVESGKRLPARVATSLQEIASRSDVDAFATFLGGAERFSGEEKAVLEKVLGSLQARFQEAAAVVKPSTAEGTAPSSPSVQSFGDQLNAALPAERAPLLSKHLREVIARALGISDASEIDPTQSLLLLGMDSLVGHQIYREATKTLGVTKKFPVGRFFEKPTVEAFTRLLLDEVLELGSTTPRSPAPSAVAEAPPVIEEVSTSLSPFEETRVLSGGRLARFCLCRAKARHRGPTLLLLHGAAANHHYFATFAEHLGQCDVLIPSLPGRCGSDGPPAQTVADAARWVRDLLAEVDLRQVVVVGHSYGGAVALELALMQAGLPPEKRSIRGLVLISTGARLSVDTKLRGTLTSPGETSPAGNAFSLLQHSAARGASEASLRDVARALAPTPMATSVSDFAACDEFDRRDAVGRITLPTLVLTGSADRLAPMHLAHDLEQQISGSRLVVLDGVGHHPPLEAAADVSDHIRSFLAGIEAPRAGADARSDVM